MKTPVMPDAWTITAAPTPAPVAPKPEAVSAKPLTARVDMSDDVAGRNLCPACKTTMIECVADDIPVLACRTCRAVLPTADNPNAEAEEQELTKNLGLAMSPFSHM